MSNGETEVLGQRAVQNLKKKGKCGVITIFVSLALRWHCIKKIMYVLTSDCCQIAVINFVLKCSAVETVLKSVLIMLQSQAE